ncbi:MAG: hypothetical protein GXO14_00360 [Thermococci archaeon]|nr:hypothetical protein [Thermococci archaeon]
MRVALVTRDPRVYYTASKVLKEYGIGFHSLIPGEDVPPDVEVIVTDEATSPRLKFPRKVVVRDEGFIDDLLVKLSGSSPRTVCISIDPGERPGLSVIGDGRIIEVMHLSSPRDVGPILSLLRRYPKARLKIGHGARRQRMLLLRALAEELGEEYTVTLVDESGTTPKVSYAEGKSVRDIVAAINIGLRTGEETTIREALNVDEPSKGEIDYIKRRSREISGNITIPTRLAKEVALGRMTVEEAVRLHSRRMDGD